MSSSSFHDEMPNSAVREPAFAPDGAWGQWGRWPSVLKQCGRWRLLQAFVCVYACVRVCVCWCGRKARRSGESLAAHGGFPHIGNRRHHRGGRRHFVASRVKPSATGFRHHLCMPKARGSSSDVRIAGICDQLDASISTATIRHHDNGEIPRPCCGYDQ